MRTGKPHLGEKMDIQYPSTVYLGCQELRHWCRCGSGSQHGNRETKRKGSSTQYRDKSAWRKCMRAEVGRYEGAGEEIVRLGKTVGIIVQVEKTECRCTINCLISAN